MAVGIPIVVLNFCIPGERSQGGKIPLRLHPSSSAQAHCARAKLSSGRDSGHSPLLSQLGCRLQRWTGHRQGYWQTASSSGPSQRALCRARHGQRRDPSCRPPDGATAPADSAVLPPEQTLALILALAPFAHANRVSRTGCSSSGRLLYRSSGVSYVRVCSSRNGR